MPYRPTAVPCTECSSTSLVWLCACGERVCADHRFEHEMRSGYCLLMGVWAWKKIEEKPAMAGMS